MKNTIEYRGQVFDRSHGSPFDRGAADSWYSRPRDPHYWPQGTYNGRCREISEMSAEQVQAYLAGYDYNEQYGGKKSYS